MNYRKNSKVLETYLDENGVMRFNLNSPENLNALSENMMDLMQNALDKASHNKNVRVIIPRIIVTLSLPSFANSQRDRIVKEVRQILLNF